MTAFTPKEKIYFQDELRYGTRTDATRRWMPLGERPLCRVRIGYQFGHLFTALCPYTGDVFAMLLPNLNKECFQLFTQQFMQHTNQATTLILDRASAHRYSQLPNDLQLLFLPTACPELNPVERFFKEIRKELKCRLFDSIQQVEQRLEQILQKYFQKPQLVINTSLFPYLNTQ